MKRRVKITKDGQEAEVMPSSLHIWEERGWTTVGGQPSDDGSSETGSEVPTEEPPAELREYHFQGSDKDKE